MSTLFILGAVQALFFALLIMFRKKTRADRFLISFFLLMCLFLLFAYSNTFQFYKTFPLIMPLIVLVPLLYGPVLYFYVSELYSLPNKKRKYEYHLIPIVIYFLIMSPIFMKENRAELIGFFNAQFIELPLYINLGVLIQYLSAPTYFVFILRMLSKHKKNIKNAFSQDENINLSWLNYLVIGAITLWILETSMIVRWNYFDLDTSFTFSYIVKSCYVIFIFLMGFYGIRQGDIFSEQDIALSNEKQTQTEDKDGTQIKRRNPCIGEEGDVYKNKLLSYIAESKAYLNNNIKLLDIAIELDIAPHILSSVINHKLEVNYFDFINSYRVKDAEKMLIDNTYRKFTILAIAFECGFNSKSSFNRIFKKQTGLTPSEYQKQKQSPLLD